MADDSLTFKILILGDSNVGKTSILLTYTDKFFTETHVATIGVEYKIKSIKIKNYNIRLQIWDTSGQERFKSLTGNFIRGSDGIIFVYDITNRKSFDAIKEWIKNAESNADGFEQLLVGNKCDLNNRRQVEKELADKLAAKKGIKNFETSAKTDVNIDKVFETLAELIIGDKTKEQLIEKYSDRENKRSVITKGGDGKGKKKKKCC